MSLLTRLFGRGRKPAPGPAPETYKGFRITAMPEKAPGGFRIGALIEKDLDGEARRHHMVRADVIAAQDEAHDASLRKAKQMIDEQGEALF